MSGKFIEAAAIMQFAAVDTTCAASLIYSALRQVEEDCAESSVNCRWRVWAPVLTPETREDFQTIGDVIFKVRDFESYQSCKTAFEEERITFHAGYQLEIEDAEPTEAPADTNPKPREVRADSLTIVWCKVDGEIVLRIRAHERMNCVEIDFA